VARALSAGATGLDSWHGDSRGRQASRHSSSDGRGSRWPISPASEQSGQPHARVERHVESRCYGSTTHASRVAGAVSCTRQLLSRPAAWANRRLLGTTTQRCIDRVETHKRHSGVAAACAVLASEQHDLPPPLIAASALLPGNLCHIHRVDLHAGPSCTKPVRASQAWD
jgi:hypothetical protein